MGRYSRRKRRSSKNTPVRSLLRPRHTSVILIHLSKLPEKDPEGAEGPNLRAKRGFDQVTLYLMEPACNYPITPMGQYRVHILKFTAIQARAESDWVSLGELF